MFSFHKDQKFIDTAGKTTSKLGNSQSLKVINYVQSEQRYYSTRSPNFLDIRKVRGTFLLPPTIQTSLKFCVFATLHLGYFSKTSHSNLATLLIFLSSHVQGLFPLTGLSQIKNNNNKKEELFVICCFYTFFPGI